MIVAVDLPGPVAEALAREAALAGLTAAQWLQDRLADRFGLKSETPSSTLTNNANPDEHH